MDAPTRNRILLLSGGIDSAVVLALHRREIFACVFVDYRQPAAHEEYRASQAICAHYKTPLTRMTAEIPLVGTLDTEAGATGPRVVPGRNLIMISLAIGYAVQHHCTLVEFGATADDAAEYPDCRAGFVGAVNALVGPAYGMHVGGPLIQFTKARVLALARQFKVPLDLVWSCYQPLPDGKQCGTCNSCVQFAQALAAPESTPELDV